MITNNNAVKERVVSKLILPTYICYYFSHVDPLGFLCGECPHGSGNEVQGLAFNLLECVSCETGDRVLFVFICKLIHKFILMVPISDIPKAYLGGNATL